mmetsp:Transcript_37701/g.31835  ORF Transcript_37701/g.31835 Transcript_37701/m.31835 type:complete len:117 (+) Transcript_37701:11-361(+)
MALSRDKLFKKRNTGGLKPKVHKKRAHQKHRFPAMCKLGEVNKYKNISVYGGGVKKRSITLKEANWSWASEGVTRKSKIVNVVFNPQSNELQRTNTLTKRTIVNIDATPFKEFIRS